MPQPPKPQPNDLTERETLYILRQYLRPEQLENEQLLRFIYSYMTCRDQAQAARTAGAPGKGSYWRSKPEVHAAIEALTNKMVMKYGFDGNELVERVKEIAGIDPIAFENPDGSYKTHLSQIDPEVRRAIKEFTVKNIYGEDQNGMKIVTGQLVEVKLYDKLKGLEFLGREKGVFKETRKVEHDVTNNMRDTLLASSARADDRLRDVMEITGRTDDGQEAKVDSDDEGRSGDGV